MATRPVPLDLGEDTPTLLKLEIEGILLFEEQIGDRPITDIFEMRPTAKMTLQLLWAALVWQKPGLALDDVKKIYNAYHERTGGTYVELIPPLIEAVSEALVRKAKPNGHDEARSPNLRLETAVSEPSPPGSTT